MNALLLLLAYFTVHFFSLSIMLMTLLVLTGALGGTWANPRLQADYHPFVEESSTESWDLMFSSEQSYQETEEFSTDYMVKEPPFSDDSFLSPLTSTYLDDLDTSMSGLQSDDLAIDASDLVVPASDCPDLVFPEGSFEYMTYGNGRRGKRAECSTFIATAGEMQEDYAGKPCQGEEEPLCCMGDEYRSGHVDDCRVYVGILECLHERQGLVYCCDDVEEVTGWTLRGISCIKIGFA